MSFAILFQGYTFKKKITNNLNYSNSIIKTTFEQASEHIKYNLLHHIKNHVINFVHLKYYTQAMILTNAVAIYKYWQSLKKNVPKFMAGHSIGEYAALVCSNVITLLDALTLVMLREKLMYDVNRKESGAMEMIIGLHENKIQDIINNYLFKNQVNIACINPNNCIVISGNSNKVQQVILKCKKNGALYTIKFPYNIMSHCYLMKTTASKLLNTLHSINFKRPTCRIVNNVDVKCEYLKKNICSALVRQMYKTVLWKQSIEYIINKNVSTLLQIGSNSRSRNIYTQTTKISVIPLNNINNIHKALKII
ncbi:malonyl CoA-acyl carrier protein transacylase [Buchnera aphidicola (Nipponaphis monzeni)]|uniref:Malonyl CoA-acyl carrier protein transacylase n=1 Tax=Buchnera aphidicola (Nipponaphis monzeni) TaxID=2495405 RepID=A0A455TAB6_9GAMM|nr:ACP S-malonyltransferase [Buchnera aphidicola]BBI01278.1 malonyl CoA-acyl carrier protein transacylase [Buchnera aphidicola (Nipponaphis monzeni)]